MFDVKRKMEWKFNDSEMFDTWICGAYKIKKIKKDTYHLWYKNTQLNSGNGYDFKTITEAKQEAKRFDRLI